MIGHALVIRPGALGDAILTLPALHALRLAGANSITVLGTPASWRFVRSAHDGLRIRDFSSTEWLGLFSETALSEPARAALARTQTAVVYLSGDTTGVERVLRNAGVQQCVFAEPPRASRSAGVSPASLDSQAGETPALHASRRLLQPLEKIPEAEACGGVALEPVSIVDDVFLRLEETEIVAALAKLGIDAPPAAPPYKGEGSGFVGIHPGSGGRAKCWPAKSFARLLVKIASQGFTPLVFFGQADDAVREEFETEIPPGVDWECVANWNLREVLALLTCCRAFIGNDSGMSHLAARACPTVALFGPTNPEVWSPLGQNVEIVRAPNNELSRLNVDDVLEKIV